MMSDSLVIRWLLEAGPKQKPFPKLSSSLYSRKKGSWWNMCLFWYSYWMAGPYFFSSSAWVRGLYRSHVSPGVLRNLFLDLALVFQRENLERAGDDQTQAGESEATPSTRRQSQAF